MSVLSSGAHPFHTCAPDHEWVLIDDAVLPAARHLTGDDARHVLDAVVQAAEGRLEAVRPSHVQYRPGSELVVRYETTVSWRGAAPVAETLLAATTSRGPLPGTVPLVAETDDGQLHVGVWRWPFDPILPGLGAAVTATGISAILGVDPRSVRLEVVAYRPTERAVVRATTDRGSTHYVKVVRPDAVGSLVERHVRLAATGVPVPVVTSHDPTTGIIVMDELTGATLRERLKRDLPPWPGAAEFRRLTATLAAAPLQDVTPVRGRLSDALGHARMLAEIAPARISQLERLTERLRSAAERSDQRRGAIVHGDLYEAQLIVDGPRIVGLLDIDDVGPGDPLDDLATVLGHLRYRAGTTRTNAARLSSYADELRQGFCTDGHDGPAVEPDELDLVTGAVLIGLATGPFRIQQRDWSAAVGCHLDTAEALMQMRTVSAPHHRNAIHPCENGGIRSVSVRSNEHLDPLEGS